ncbi:unnamed protein product [Lota lota]
MPNLESFSDCRTGSCSPPGWTGAPRRLDAAEGPGGLPFPWAATLLSSVLIITIVVDIIGNMLVVISVLRNKKLRKAGNAFVVSLALADLLVAVYPYPLVLTAIFNGGWIAGHLQCQLSGFLMGLSVVGSTFNIAGIAVNRYCYMCHGLRYDKVFSGGNTARYVLLAWALAVVAVAPNWLVGSLRYDARVYSCTFAQSVSALYTAAVVAVHFLLPVAVVSYCYLRIWILVVRAGRRVKPNPGPRVGPDPAPGVGPDPGPRVKPRDLRNFLTMFAAFAVFAVCWAPINLIGLAVALDARLGPAVPEWLFAASYFLAYSNSCLNAVVYGALNHNFRQEYKRIAVIIFRAPLRANELTCCGSRSVCFDLRAACCSRCSV